MKCYLLIILYAFCLCSALVNKPGTQGIQNAPDCADQRGSNPISHVQQLMLQDTCLAFVLELESYVVLDSSFLFDVGVLTIFAEAKYKFS